MNSEKRNARGRGRGRGRARGRGRGRGRGKKVPKVMSSDEEECSVEDTSQEAVETNNEDVKEEPEPTEPPKLEVPSDISQLEAPVFTTLQRGPPEPMLRLDWSHRATLIGEKVLNPMIYCCDICSKPILIYGRMIPCKHVFCLLCARSEHTHCPRCRDKVLRVEQTGLGTVFMCTHAGTRYGNDGCRRTYLSQRDLQAHINHRHVTSASGDVKPEPEPAPPALLNVKPLSLPPSANDPRAHAGGGAGAGTGGTHPPPAAAPHPGDSRRRSNLITVPIQQETDSQQHNYYNYYPAPQPVPAPAAAPSVPVVTHNMSVPPPPYYTGAPHYAAVTSYQTGAPAPVGGVMPAAGALPGGGGEAPRWGDNYTSAPPPPHAQWPHHYYR